MVVGVNPFYANAIQPTNSTVGFAYRVALPAGCFIFAPVLDLDAVGGAEVLHSRQPHHVLLRDFHVAQLTSKLALENNHSRSLTTTRPCGVRVTSAEVFVPKFQRGVFPLLSLALATSHQFSKPTSQRTKAPQTHERESLEENAETLTDETASSPVVSSGVQLWLLAA